MKKNLGRYNDTYTGKLFLLCWAAYFSTYICRLNFSAVMPEILKSGSLSQSSAASVSSAFFICYGVGQLFSGFIGDRVSPRKMIFSGIFISALSNILIFIFSSSYTLILLLWGINGAVQSMVWSPILRIAGEYFSSSEHEKFGIDMSTTVPLGTLASYGVSMLALELLPWKFVFLICGLIVFASSFIWIFGTGRILPRMKTYAKTLSGEKNKANTLPIKKLIKIMVYSGIPILFISIAIHGTLKDSVTQWIPAFLSDSFGTKTNITLLLTMILPIINVTGAYFARMLNKKIKDEITTSAVFFCISAIFLTVLILFGTDNLIIAMVCMTGVTNCMFAVNVMLITLLPLNFSKFGCTSTVGGILNAFAYIGCGILNAVSGYILENSNASWNMMIIMWLVLAIAAVIFTFAANTIRRHFMKKFSE